MSMLPRWLLLLVMALLLVWNNCVLAQSGSVAAGIGAKLRADATQKSAVLALLPAGTPVDVHEAKGGYARVSAAGKKGWVAQRLLSMKAVPQRRGGKQSCAVLPAAGKPKAPGRTRSAPRGIGNKPLAQARHPHRHGHGRLPKRFLAERRGSQAALRQPERK